MSSTPKIESSDLSIEQVYKDFYAVPDYQREYVWDEDDVLSFADDIYDEFYGPKGDLIKDVEYFIGSIVVCKNAHGVYELIDGQQRMTTIYLFLCAIREFLKQKSLDTKMTLEGMIYANRLSEDYQDIRDFRLVLQYDDSRGVLEKIAGKTVPFESIKKETRSIVCLLSAYRTIADFLEARFGNDPVSVHQFFGAFVQRVKLIRIVTPNLSHALKVFETVNDRGVGLTAMDLLKNLLFMRTKPEEYPKLKVIWKKVTDDLDASDEKHLRFLRYYVMANYTDFRMKSGKPLREDEIYEWFSDHVKETGLDKHPRMFAETLVSAAHDYRRFADGQDPAGGSVSFLDNIQSLSGKARQHFILMLAARHLPSDAIAELAKQLECLFFTFLITREPTKNFESYFGDWAKELRDSKDKEDVMTLVQNRIWPLMRQKSKDFDFALSQLTSERIQKYRLKYVLAKLAQHVEQLAWQGAESTKTLAPYLDGKIEIEHILPRGADALQRTHFDKVDEYDNWAERLGNLTLLEKPLNSSVSKGLFDEKKAAYTQSKLLLTKAIASSDGYGKENTLMKALDKLSSYAEWTSIQIEQRQQLLVLLSRQVWLMDVAVNAENQ